MFATQPKKKADQFPKFGKCKNTSYATIHNCKKQNIKIWKCGQRQYKLQQHLQRGIQLLVKQLKDII